MGFVQRTCTCAVILMCIPLIMQLSVILFPDDIYVRIAAFSGILVVFTITLVKVQDYLFDNTFREQQRRRMGGRPIDTSLITRVVVVERTGKEYLINGLPNQTFKEACSIEWPFRGIARNSDWIIKDKRGNDISNTPLSDYDDLCYLEAAITTTPVQLSDKLDESDQFSTHHDAVEYYD